MNTVFSLARLLPDIRYMYFIKPDYMHVMTRCNYIYRGKQNDERPLFNIAMYQAKKEEEQEKEQKERNERIEKKVTDL